MARANLKRMHRGWSRLANRILHAGPFDVQLALPTAYPFRYRPGSTDLLVLEQVFLEGEYDADRIPGGEVEYIVDCGSNIGVTALLWAERYPHARIALVEPDDENFELLRANTAAFADRCTLVKAAIAPRRGKTVLYVSNREYSHSTVRTDDCIASTEVPALTIPDILEVAEFPRVDLLKLDIEGGEQGVLPTMADWPAKPRFMISEIHPPYGTTAFVDDCRRSGLVAFPTRAAVENVMFAARAA